MAYVYADKSGAPRVQRTKKRAERKQYDPLKQRAKLLSDLLWERAKKIADILAPDEPVDEEKLSDSESWLILEHAALSFSPMMWDDPDALQDLYELRKKFLPPLATEDLMVRARELRKQQNMLPDPSITPQSPEWEKRLNRIKR